MNVSLFTVRHVVEGFVERQESGIRNAELATLFLRPLSLVPLRPYSTAAPALIYCAFLAKLLCCGKHFIKLN